ncbi:MULTISPECIES: DUF1330 domain-containing protein [unclassified Pseudoalteromonas]|uniref:DUF1330 domain-containing protein n=1 Tax=unclassified Pseudoalteromonas TaxID=194690 RepID=UPI0025B7A1D5|nr:DUF1330 domain-containing protein [Pseudoalteromonas sp. XMcav2-N]
MYEYLVGLEVTDDEVYGQYRTAMKPILDRYQGGFGFDFIVSKVLKSETNEPINRVFTIYFPSKEIADDFFIDPEYVKVKACYFDASVAHTTIISGYEKHN